jgi:hypothetical protein
MADPPTVVARRMIEESKVHDGCAHTDKKS